VLDIIGGREKKDRSDSRPVELLPSNKTLYLDKLNNEEVSTLGGSPARDGGR
jgi:hypothetical protein